jgi:ABC-type glycerol-3-phosphate transport system permease component
MIEQHDTTLDGIVPSLVRGEGIGERSGHYDLLMAAAVTLRMPPAPMFLFFQRHVVSGLTAGAVK